MFVVDSFHGAFAVVIGPDGASCRVARDELPDGIREGDVIARENGAWRVDEPAAREIRQRIRALEHLARKRDDRDDAAAVGKDEVSGATQADPAGKEPS